MTAASDLQLQAGGRLWLDGQGWEVAEISGATVRLIASGQLRTVSVSSLLDVSADVAAEPEPVDELFAIPSLVLASLSTAERAALESQVGVLRRLLDPDPGDERTVGQRYEAATVELGVTRRTLERQVSRFRQFGPAGLVDARKLRDVRRSVDPRWDEICSEVLASYSGRSNPTRQRVIDQTNSRYAEAVPDGLVPTRSVAYMRLAELDKGRYTFGAAKQRRSVAKRPRGVLGRLRADRPGQYVLMDSYRLDVFAMEPVTLRWVNTELTVAMDLFDRCITGLRLRPVAAQSPDVASVLFQTVTPQTWGWHHDAAEGPYGGLPDGIVLADPGGVLPDTIVVDHGKIYLSEHTRSVCERLGISIQPAIPDKPTDKPALERFFRTLRQSLLEQLPGYKGPDVWSRGQDVEKEAFYYVGELEQLIREWVGRGLPPQPTRRAGRPAGVPGGVVAGGDVRPRCRRGRQDPAPGPPGPDLRLPRGGVAHGPALRRRDRRPPLRRARAERLPRRPVPVWRGAPGEVADHGRPGRHPRRPVP